MAIRLASQQCNINLFERIRMSETQRQNLRTSNLKINNFIRHLHRNRLGQTFHHFLKMERPKRIISKVHEISKQKKYLSVELKLGEHQKYPNQVFSLKKSERYKSLPQDNKTVRSFNLRVGPLGQSVRLFNSFKSQSRQRSQKSPKGTQLFAFARDKPIKNDGSSKSRIKSITISKGLRRIGEQKKSIEQQLLELRKYDDYSNLAAFLSRIANNNNIQNIRIYREKFHRIYNNRYGNEKLTTFFEYEYIEDTSSQSQLAKQLVSLTYDQILCLVFVVFDQNGDGLICNHDLFSIAMFSQKENCLINADVYRIISYTSNIKASQQASRIMDPIQDAIIENSVFKIENLTLKKLRFFMIKEQKERKKQANEMSSLMKHTKKSRSNLDSSSVKIDNTIKSSKKAIILTKRVSKHLFSLHEDEDESFTIIKELRKRMAKQHFSDQKVDYSFKINFQRFRKIFEGTLPETFYDILFLIGQIRIKGRSYCEVKVDTQEIQQISGNQKEVDRYLIYRQKIYTMRQVYRERNIQNLKNFARHHTLYK